MCVGGEGHAGCGSDMQTIGIIKIYIIYSIEIVVHLVHMIYKKYVCMYFL